MPAETITEADSEPEKSANQEAFPTSSWAMASAYCGVLGCMSLGTVGALICGWIALRRINASSGRLRGTRLAWFGMGVGVALFLPVAIGVVSAMKPMGVVQRMWIIRAAGEALRKHAQDHDGKIAATNQWTVEITPVLRAFSEERPGTKVLLAANRYCLNAALAGRHVEHISPDSVLLFELQTPTSNASGDSFGRPSTKTAPAIVKGRVLVLFADGHCEVIPTNRLASLRWNP